MKTITETLLDAPIEILAKRYSQLSEKECESAIEAAFLKANFALKDITSETAYATITGAFIRGRSITFGHVGANRLYWIDHNKIQQLTRDHLLRQNLPRLEWLLYSALGQNPQTLTLNVSTHKDISDGYLVLCTWRLWESIDESGLRDAVMTSTTLQNACTRLVKSTRDPLDERSLAVIIASNPKYKPS